MWGPCSGAAGRVLSLGGAVGFGAGVLVLAGVALAGRRAAGVGV